MFEQIPKAQKLFCKPVTIYIYIYTHTQWLKNVDIIIENLYDMSLNSLHMFTIPVNIFLECPIGN